jgi:hypothetical protein
MWTEGAWPFVDRYALRNPPLVGGVPFTLDYFGTKPKPGRAHEGFFNTNSDVSVDRAPALINGVGHVAKNSGVVHFALGPKGSHAVGLHGDTKPLTPTLSDVVVYVVYSAAVAPVFHGFLPTPRDRRNEAARRQ